MSASRSEGGGRSQYFIGAAQYIEPVQLRPGKSYLNYCSDDGRQCNVCTVAHCSVAHYNVAHHNTAAQALNEREVLILQRELFVAKTNQIKFLSKFPSI